MESMDELFQLSESMMQAAALLADEDIDESSPSQSPSSKRSSTFLNVVVLGNMGAGKSAVLNSLIGHPVLPTGENGATRATISIDLHRDGSLSSKAIILVIDNRPQQVSASNTVLNCHESVIYILAPMRYATVYGCSDATVVLGATGKVVPYNTYIHCLKRTCLELVLTQSHKC